MRTLTLLWLVLWGLPACAVSVTRSEERLCSPDGDAHTPCIVIEGGGADAAPASPAASAVADPTESDICCPTDGVPCFAGTRNALGAPCSCAYSLSWGGQACLPDRITQLCCSTAGRCSLDSSQREGSRCGCTIGIDTFPGSACVD